MMFRNYHCVMNLANSIIGVGILAIPFCLKQCGILLGLLLLIVCTWFTMTSCNLLISAGVHSQRRSYEYLALFAYGPKGKLAVEIGMIGLQLGCCIAFHIVIGDLGPAIISKIFHVENSVGLRSAVMIALTFLIAFPLSLRRNIASLSGISSMSLMFYVIFIFFLFGMAFPNLWSGSWLHGVNFWRPQGFFRCLPIFSLTFACQAQLFIVYDSLHDPSLAAMSTVVYKAIGLVSTAYSSVGLLGYIAFYSKEISGDILTSFPPNLSATLIQLGFLMSVTFSFPLIIFPCRLSIYTLLCAQKNRGHDIQEDTSVPELHFNIITSLILLGTLTIGILIPKVDFVLGLCGSTTGCLVSYIMPPLLFIKVMTRTPEHKILARVILVTGIIILSVSTYTTLTSHSKVNVIVEHNVKDIVKSEDHSVNKIVQRLVTKDDEIKIAKAEIDKKKDTVKNGHQEPILPQPPKNEQQGDKKNNVVNKPSIISIKKEKLKDVDPAQIIKVKDTDAKIVENKAPIKKMEIKSIAAFPDTDIKSSNKNNTVFKVLNKRQVDLNIVTMTDKTDISLKQPANERSKIGSLKGSILTDDQNQLAANRNISKFPSFSMNSSNKNRIKRNLPTDSNVVSSPVLSSVASKEKQNVIKSVGVNKHFPDANEQPNKIYKQSQSTDLRRNLLQSSQKLNIHSQSTKRPEISLAHKRLKENSL